MWKIRLYVGYINVIKNDRRALGCAGRSFWMGLFLPLLLRLLLLHLPIQHQLELGLVELLVDAALGEEGIVGAPLLNDAARQDQYLVRRQDGGEPVGDDDAGPARHQRLQGLLDGAFGDGIQGRRGFVQNEDLGVLQYDPGDGQPLLLAAG